MCQIALQTNKPDVKTLVLVSIQLLIFCLQFLLWKHQTDSDLYMTIRPKLGLQCNSFPGSTNRLAINQVRIHLESGKEATLCHSNPQKHEESCLTRTLVL